MKKLTKIAFGGGCHWCTEAVFQSLLGVSKVEQGFVASTGQHNSFSEAVIVHFNVAKISLTTLIEIHLNTHKSTSNHSMRTKYRSAVYTFFEEQKHDAERFVESFQNQFTTN
ncbi:MAG: peptide-methionine (S)-S-oxide reductase [Flavobacteriaceae bacterium]